MTDGTISPHYPKDLESLFKLDGKYKNPKLHVFLNLIWSWNYGGPPVWLSTGPFRFWFSGSQPQQVPAFLWSSIPTGGMRYLYSTFRDWFYLVCSGPPLAYAEALTECWIGILPRCVQYSVLRLYLYEHSMSRINMTMDLYLQIALLYRHLAYVLRKPDLPINPIANQNTSNGCYRG